MPCTRARVLFFFSTGTLTTIEYQRESLENANTNTEVLKIMNQAALALKGAHDHMDIDKVGILKACVIFLKWSKIFAFWFIQFAGGNIDGRSA